MVMLGYLTMLKRNRDHCVNLHFLLEMCFGTTESQLESPSLKISISFGLRLIM